jgi:hypothetical protein
VSLEKLMQSPTAEDLREARERANAKRRYWREHYGEFDRTYHGQFVAVKDGEFLDADVKFERLADRLEARGFALRDVWMRFIGRDYVRMTL